MRRGFQTQESDRQQTESTATCDHRCPLTPFPQLACNCCFVHMKIGVKTVVPTSFPFPHNLECQCTAVVLTSFPFPHNLECQCTDIFQNKLALKVEINSDI